MGIFDVIKSVSKMVVISEVPKPDYMRGNNNLKKTHSSNRGKVEDKVSEVNPTLGKVVHKINNTTDTIDNVLDTLNNGVTRLFEYECENFELADHLFVQRVGYTHHGIYIGGNCVIHYLADRVQIDDLEKFADGARIHKKTKEDSPMSFKPEEAVLRAKLRCGEDNYNVIINNCENFVRWCRCGSELY